MPVTLISKIKPQNNGQFPMYDDIDGYGGFQVRQNVTDRNSIPALNRKQGMMVFTIAEQTFWQLGSDGVTWHQSVFAPNFTFTGDLSGSDIIQFVVGLQGRAVADIVPTDGYALIWNQSMNAWIPESIININNLSGIPSNEYGGAGNKLLIPATETILGSATNYPAVSASAGLTTTDNAWHTILARAPQGVGRWQVSIVGEDGYGNEFSGHLDFHVNSFGVTFPSPGSPVPQGYPIINPLYVGSGTSLSTQAIFSSGQVQIQVKNFLGGGSSNPVKWGAWLQDLTRL